METINELKDTARKTTNTVVDKAEGVLGITKPPKELAGRLVEHLNHHEYTKIAEILTDEGKKYVAHMGLSDVDIINQKIDDFSTELTNLADNLEADNYQQVQAKLREFEQSIPDDVEVFKIIKAFFNKIIEATEEYAKNGAKGIKKELDFSSLQGVFEEYFHKLTNK